MVGFGELRKLSIKWQTDIAAVERLYALDWLLAGIFGRAVLGQALTLRGAAALGKAHFTDYPPIVDADLVRDPDLDLVQLESELSKAADDAARSSGLQFRLHSVRSTEAKFEFTGPLGRRSAAQPRLPLRFSSTPLRGNAVQSPLIHPFAERCEATIRAVSLEEIAARIIAGIGGKPRVHDVFDLWFILRHGDDTLNREGLLALSQEFAREKGVSVRAEFEPAYRLLLERAWNGGLKHVRDKPAFEEAEAEITSKLNTLLG